MIFPVSVPLLSLTVLVRIRPWKQEKIYGGMMNHRRHLFILNLFMSRQMSQVLSFIRVGQQVNLKGLFMLARSEEHTSELQSRGHLVCRLLLEKKKKKAQ